MTRQLKKGDVVRFLPGAFNEDRPHLIGTYDVVKCTFEDRFPDARPRKWGTTVQLEFETSKWWYHEDRFEKVEDENG